MRLLLNIYKSSLSPILKYLFGGGGCRFYHQELSCSEYAVDVIEKYGIIRGIPLALKRVLKCNNWTR